MLTPAALTNFYTQASQMGLDAAIVPELTNDGMRNIDTFDAYHLEDLINIQKRINRDPALPHFGQHSLMRLATACDAVRYYDEVGRPITAEMMRWSTRLRRFGEGMKILRALQDKTAPEIQQISRSLPIDKWVEAVENTLKATYGTRDGLALSYVIRKHAIPADATPLVDGQAYCAEHGSLRDELIARAPHDHPGFAMDNDAVFNIIVLGVQGTKYAASIVPFNRTRNGRGAWNALISHYLGDDKWNLDLVKYAAIMANTIWKGHSNVTIESHIGLHRNAFQRLTAASHHVAYQVPNSLTRVKQLLDGIQSTDARLNAAIAQVQADDAMKADFELASANIQPCCPIARKQGLKRTGADISATEATQAHIGSIHGGPRGTGPKTGVSLRFHVPDEYKKLSKEERSELHEWRQTPAGKAAVAADMAANKRKQPSPKRAKKTANVSSLVKKEMSKLFKDYANDEEKKGKEATKEKVLSALAAAVDKDPSILGRISATTVGSIEQAPEPAPAATKVRKATFDPNFLASILKKAKNPGSD